MPFPAYAKLLDQRPARNASFFRRPGSNSYDLRGGPFRSKHVMAGDRTGQAAVLPGGGHLHGPGTGYRLNGFWGRFRSKTTLPVVEDKRPRRGEFHQGLEPLFTSVPGLADTAERQFHGTADAVAVDVNLSRAHLPSDPERPARRPELKKSTIPRSSVPDSSGAARR